MNVVKSTTRPCSTRAHLLCVPGSTASTPRSPAPTAPSNLRFLAAHHVGNARRIARRDAGNDRQHVAAARATTRSASAVSDAGQSTYGASTQPCRLPIMPHAMRGAGSSMPVAEQLRERRLEPPVANVLDAERNALRGLHGARRRRADTHAPTVVPQSIATSAVARHGPVARYQRACGFVVARARFDPALAVRQPLLLPERRARLQVVHDEFARVERRRRDARS